MEWKLLESVSPDDRARVLAAARRRSYARGEVIFHEGDPADSLHLVSSGRLAVRISTPDGQNATLNILGVGDYFGELALLQRAPAQRSATLMALEPAETMAISATSFHALRRQHPQVSDLMVALLAARVEELSARLLEALHLTLDQRVFRRLNELVTMYAEGPSSTAAVTIPLTQDQLADLVGGTRPSVNVVLQRLAQQGVVSLGRGRLEITDRPALRRKAG